MSTAVFVFAVLDGGGGRGALSYGVSFAKRAIATDDMAFGRARARRFRLCAGPIAAALNLHVKGGALPVIAASRARARGAREFGPRRRRVIFCFCCARRRRWPRRSELRGQLRQEGDRNRRHGLRTCSRSAFSPLRRADRGRIEFACERGRVACYCCLAGAREGRARIWAAAPPCYFLFLLCSTAAVAAAL